MLVGDLSSVTPSGSVPDQPGPVIAKCPGFVPVVRLPGDAKMLVHASIIGIR